MARASRPYCALWQEIDQDYIGEIARSKGYTVGLMEQGTSLDESKTVIEVIKTAVQPNVDPSG
jgi:ATPase subunit of ABC transporter with duplicated ATPase domains